MKVLITDMVDPLLIEGLTELGYQPDYQPNINLYDVAECIHNYVGIIVTTKIALDSALIQRAEKLKFIARLGSGTDHIDTEAALTKNIRLITTPEANAGSVGEHAVGMIIHLLHNFSTSHDAVKRGIFDSNSFRVQELSELTVGIIGYGNTGSAFAKRLQGFDTEVIGFGKYRDSFDQYCKKVSLQELQKRAHILGIHLPLTKETRNLITASYLSRFERLWFVINTSRGNILNLHAVLDMVNKESLQGAGLDVIDNEEVETYTQEEKEFYHLLSIHPRILITPHIAGKSHSTRKQHAKILLKKLKSF